ncbi:malto-oligosyltrehalose trehalohydrolase [Georgenia sp. Z1491]|uniref:malto-oligosyltrehalose trehalohydrolase n=1 Tax=Georgenia sp. Z1491 TaxID=3416707 RepID=UPI003CF77CFB
MIPDPQDARPRHPRPPLGDRDAETDALVRHPLVPAVWSPDASSIDAVVTAVGPADGEQQAAAPAVGRHRLVRRSGGWWTADAPWPSGTEYLFSRDGGDPVPDPRSAHQPDGVHGPSRLHDPSTFDWTDMGFAGVALPGSVIYELHVGTFTAEGTLDAAITHLGGLAELGVTMIELMPLAAFPGVRGWGYDGVGLYAVQDSYGGPAALQRFVDAAHSHGLGVCLDVVYNHLGPDGNYLGVFADYVTERHQTPWGSGPDLDGERSAEVRAFFLENALRWLSDFHVDALRLDAVHAIEDTSEPHLLAELADRVHALGESLGLPRTLVAESDLNDHAMVTPTAEGGLGMDAQWVDDVHHALHAWLTGEGEGYYVDFGAGSTLAHALTRVFVHDGGWSTFRGQDWGRPVDDDVDGHRFVVFGQNHDQVGNRAVGDRPSVVLDDAQLAVSAAIVLLSPYTPMLFMGEEWGARTPFQFFTDHIDPDLGRAVTEGRRAEFARHGWGADGEQPEVPDPQDPATREASVLDRDEATTERGHRIRAFYAAALALRRAEPDLASGDRSATAVAVDDEAGWLRMSRGGIDVVAVTRATPDAPTTVPLAGADAIGDRPGAAPSEPGATVDGPEVLLAWDPATTSTTAGAVTLDGPGVVVVRRTGA